MAQQFVTGPCDIFVHYNFVDGGFPGPLFLGHSDRGPRIQIRPQYTMTYVDITGLRTGFDAIYDGEDALVSLALNRWNHAVYNRIARKANVSGVNARGQEGPGDVGTLMVYESQAPILWVRFPHRAKPAFRDQEAGYRFPAAFLQTDDHSDLGSKPRKIQLVFHCLRKGDFSKPNLTEKGGGLFTLFDHDMNGLPPIN